MYRKSLGDDVHFQDPKPRYPGVVTDARFGTGDTKTPGGQVTFHSRVNFMDSAVIEDYFYLKDETQRSKKLSSAFRHQ